MDSVEYLQRLLAGDRPPGHFMMPLIKQFCTTRYSVTFPMFSKIEVNGEDAAPIYKYLTSKDVEPAGTGRISWNFEKFLIDREGNLVNRFAPRTAPDDAELVKAIESQLAKK